MKSILTVVTLSLMLAACATKKPTNDAPTQAVAKVKEVVLELNGDSDADKAGKIKTVHFAYDSSALDETAKLIIKENTEYMKLNKPISVQIEGHCDERGGRQYNLALGERRATVVRNFMMSLGINGSRMKILSIGNEKPLIAGDDAHSRAKNRRANYIILSK